MSNMMADGDLQKAERSQGSFATLHHLLHSFTAGKSNKKPVAKVPQLTDAEVQHNGVE